MAVKKRSNLLERRAALLESDREIASAFETLRKHGFRHQAVKREADAYGMYTNFRTMVSTQTVVVIMHVPQSTALGKAFTSMYKKKFKAKVKGKKR